MSTKVARRTKVNKAFRKRADVWKFNASMIFPIALGIVVGIVLAVMLQLDYIGWFLASVWVPIGWAVAVGDRSGGQFIADLTKVQEFGMKRHRHTKLIKKW